MVSCSTPWRSSCASCAGAFSRLNKCSFIRFTVKRISRSHYLTLTAAPCISCHKRQRAAANRLAAARCMYLTLYLPFQQFKRFSPGPGQHHAHTAGLYAKRIRDLLVRLLKEVESKGKDLCASLSRKDRPQRRSCISRNNFIIFSRL